MRKIVVVWAVLAAGALEAQSFFRAGDTWVLSGDSITFLDLYRQTVENALDHIHPGHGIRIVNTGVWGQLAKEAEGRGVSLKPTVVSIMLGMNNVIHHDYAPAHDFTESVNRYTQTIRRQVRQYQAQGATVILMSPTLTDEAENSYFTPWNTRRGLVEYGKAIRRLCDEERCYFIPVAEEFEQAKSDLKPLETYIPDGVHPYGWGQYVVARSLIHHLRVAEPLARADEPRAFDATALPPHTVHVAAARRFLAAKDLAPTLTIALPKPGTATVRWSVERKRGESSVISGEEKVQIGKSPLVWQPRLPVHALPQTAGTIARLVVSVTPAEGRAELTVVDLARTRVLDFTKGTCAGEIRTADDRPEGPLVATWQIAEDGADLWITGHTTANGFPKRPQGGAETWMNSSGMNGVMMMLDLRPAERFADNCFDRDMHMICFSVLDRPWSVLPLVWEGRRLQNCVYANAQPTADGYDWRLGLRGYVADYTKFDIRKYDHIGINLIVDDVDAKGQMGRYPLMPYLDMETMTPERRLNQTVILDRKGTVPQQAGETTNVGTFAL